MSARWYTSRNGQVYGPYTSAQLKSFTYSRELIPEDMICLEGSTEWKRAGDVRTLFPGQPRPAQVIPPSCKVCQFCKEMNRPDAFRCNNCGEFF